MEHSRIQPLFPLLVLDSGLRDFSSRLHVPHVRRLLPDLFYHHRPSCRIHEPNGRNFWPHVFLPFLICLHFVSIFLFRTRQKS